MDGRNKLEQAWSDLDELIENAEPTDFFVNVQKAIDKRNAENLIDEHFIRQGQDWSKISNQVVGSEI